MQGLVKIIYVLKAATEAVWATQAVLEAQLNAGYATVEAT